MKHKLLLFLLLLMLITLVGCTNTTDPDYKSWTGMDLHKRAKCGIICISGIEKGYHNGKGQVQRRNEVANRQVRA